MTNKLIPSTGGHPILAYVYDGSDWRPALVDTDGHLQIDVLTSGLPAGAATSANQTTMITALQLIEDLRAALESVATDRLQVRGEDQLFSIEGAVLQTRTAVISGAGGYVDSDFVLPGGIWAVTSVVVRNVTNPITRIAMMIRSGGANFMIHEEVATYAQSRWASFQCHKYLEPGDLVRVFFGGALAGDSCTVDLTGYGISLEV